MGIKGPVAKVDRSEVITNHPPMQVELVTRTEAPSMPRGLKTAGKKAWKTFWASPVAGSVIDVDIPVLIRLCETYDRIAACAKDDPANHRDFNALCNTAMRLETAIGITAGSRARLGIKVNDQKKPTLQAVREGLG